MNKTKQKLTLDRPVIYQIKIPGLLNDSWLDWAGVMTLSVETENVGYFLTILTGTFDQAALQGLLRRLYALGIPLISVNCLDFN